MEKWEKKGWKIEVFESVREEKISISSFLSILNFTLADTIMDNLIEVNDKNSGRRIYQYVDSEGKLGKLVTRKQHILDLKVQGKLLNINIDEISFSSKRKRFSEDQIGESSKLESHCTSDKPLSEASNSNPEVEASFGSAANFLVDQESAQLETEACVVFGGMKEVGL